MADDSALALQKALVSRLKSDAALSALVSGRVYDEPPQSVTFPYVRIGNIDLRALRFSCGVDDDITFSIECYSRPTSGRVEATRIAAAVRASLDDADLELTGFSLDWCDYLTQAVIRAADGQSYIATVAFEASVALAD
ncbi:hypothetical protein AQS8620_01301 [Aquimixticola soesokkakensis]|uniref:Gene transfer agent protein n=1 Tax=Aquimixticola soesokkakensis TaxID=1519096 RepID=A0A1Y5SB01_9RHOB|nr:DUF3168 domain-containing protein [Aquimixticola soesokkakensis]SLN36573.1 hypothetical protein AQS8620_01301 [Aquimixticola soesokkakensis]